MKRTTIPVTLVLAMILTCFVGCEITDSTAEATAKEKANAAAVFTLDVNPGVRVYVRSDDTVIDIEATNEDGEGIVGEVEFDGLNYETVIEHIVDKMEEKGFLEGEESAVLISVEKKVRDVSEKLNEKIEKAFEKHGKKASVIEQELDVLDEELSKAIGDIAEKYKISKGKAHLIEKIREEFPELSEEELASLRVNDLGMMLEETSDDVKGHFKKIDPAVEKGYVGREQALAIAAESLEIAVEDVIMQRVFVTRDDGKMVYEVELVYGDMEYEITVDAESGAVLETESEKFKIFDPEDFIGDGKHEPGTNDENKIDLDEIKDQLINDALGKEENRDEQKTEPEDEHHKDKPEEEKPLSRGEILKIALAALDISEDSLKKTDVRLHKSESGAVYSLVIETDAREVYKLVLEAYCGTVLNAELDGTVLELDTASVE